MATPHLRFEDRMSLSNAACPRRFDAGPDSHRPEVSARNVADGAHSSGRSGPSGRGRERVHSGLHAFGGRSSGNTQTVLSTSPCVGRDVLRTHPLTLSGSTFFNLSDAPPVCPPNPAWDDIPAGRQTEIVDSEEPEVREPLNRISTYIEEVVREVLKHVPPDVLSLSSQGALSERTFTARLPLRTGRPQLLAEFLAGRGYAISLAASPRGPVQVLLSPGKFTSEADFYNFTFHLLEYVAMVEDREELERHYHAERPLVFRARL